MASTLLIDLWPAVGAHGQRGIGRYVRGLAASIGTFQDDLADRIWAMGAPGRALDAFGARAVTVTGFGPLAILARRRQTSIALERSGARVLHATDPQRPWSDRTVASIVTVYDLIPLVEHEMFRSWRLDHRLAYRRYVRQIGRAARIVSISRATAEDLQERLHVPPERIDVVYPMLNPPVATHRTEPAEPTFMFVGALDPHKQPELALRAFALFHARAGHGRLRYIGPPNHEAHRRLRDLATALRVSGAVSVEGRISDKDLDTAYSAATAVLSTSRIEGFGLPPVEAVLRGVPVIAVETPAAVEALHGAASIVPDDAEAIADAMSRPIQPDPRAVAEIRERHSITSVAQSLADSYRRILP